LLPSAGVYAFSSAFLIAHTPTLYAAAHWAYAPRHIPHLHHGALFMLFALLYTLARSPPPRVLLGLLCERSMLADSGHILRCAPPARPPSSTLPGGRRWTCALTTSLALPRAYDLQFYVPFLQQPHLPFWMEKNGILFIRFALGSTAAWHACLTCYPAPTMAHMPSLQNMARFTHKTFLLLRTAATRYTFAHTPACLPVLLSPS